ncbi:hypothetical protein O181_104646 [Austropuccinia psidii MF-1]|uniref:Tet-like 2OG-Fe(II) oxygenase domain-containing protein n=1 Tax=Austropuccinia psidii MF-1 TaxID=1389203 RepID=A0A9Q3JMM0_9BASI|nr:hypothetical protein [Austropuccinia psidii MF-1]
MLPHLCGTLIGPHGRTLALVGSDCANVMWAPTGKSKDVCRINVLGRWAPFWIQNFLASNGRKHYLISCLRQHKVIPQPLGNSGRSQKTNECKSTQKNRLFSSSQPTAQISMPVSANMTSSETWRVVDVNQIKSIHFGCVEMLSSTRLLIALVEFGPFTTMSEVKVNQWDELSQFLFCKKRFTDTIAINRALMEVFMFAIGWRKCSTNNEQFGLYGSVRKIENTKDEWQKQGSNPILAANASQANHYACTSSQKFKKLSTAVQAPEASHRIPYIVQVPDNLTVFLCRCRLPIIHTPILTPVQASNNSHTNPDACAGSQQSKQFLTLGQASNNSHVNLYNCTVPTMLKIPYACAGFRQFKRKS